MKITNPSTNKSCLKTQIDFKDRNIISQTHPIATVAAVCGFIK